MCECWGTNWDGAYGKLDAQSLTYIVKLLHVSFSREDSEHFLREFGKKSDFRVFKQEICREMCRLWYSLRFSLPSLCRKSNSCVDDMCKNWKYVQCFRWRHPRVTSDQVPNGITTRNPHIHALYLIIFHPVSMKLEYFYVFHSLFAFAALHRSDYISSSQSPQSVAAILDLCDFRVLPMGKFW